MRRFLFCAALLWLAAARGAGQETGASEGGEPRRGASPAAALTVEASAEAGRRLKSRGNRERAWGAYLAGAHGLKEQAPLISGLLEEPDAAAGGWEQSVVRQAALDALIRLDAEVPAASLLPHYQSSPDEVIILLARSPQVTWQALLSIFAEEMPTRHWLAVGNLLAGARAPGFAARLLEGLKVEAAVYVFSREGDHDVGGGRNGGCGCGCGSGGGDDGGFPPVGYYHLTGEAERGAAVVAAGRHNVYYVRTRSDSFCGDCPTPYARDLLRVEYVADLLRTTEDELKLEARPFREVVCKEARQCRRALADVRDGVARAHSSAVTRLLAEGLLDAAEAAELSVPDLTLTLTDYRDPKTFPLPDKLRGVKISVEDGGEGPPEP